jgi:hypothetical protein
MDAYLLNWLSNIIQKNISIYVFHLGQMTSVFNSKPAETKTVSGSEGREGPINLFNQNWLKETCAGNHLRCL